MPANIYPILRMEYYGTYSESTVWDGCVALFRNGQWVVDVLVSLVKLEQIATILPGPGLLAFTAVVELTILASASFDPKLIWKGSGDDT